MRDIVTVRSQETIVAQCTPSGAGAIALLRISGKDAVTVVDRISVLVKGLSLSSMPTHTIHYGWVVERDGTRIDNVLFLLMRGPQTFTGEDTVEITCHNNTFIIEKIIELVIEAGARLAHRGEFSYQAVLNNKIDIVQAEGINELIHANTQMGLKKALSQVNGSFSHWIKDLEKKLIKALAFCEASFEFIDEEMVFDQQIKKMVEEVLAAIDTIKVTFDKQRHIRQGVRIALIGSVNVGKSSIFNALLHQKRAIVTSIAGTTRDVIEAGLYKGGMYWTLIDTAGLRETDDSIELEGIERSLEQAELADIILLVFDGSRMVTRQERFIYQELYDKYGHKIICVCNKIDLPQIAMPWQVDTSSPVLDIKQSNVEGIAVSRHDTKNGIVFDGALGVSTKTENGISLVQDTLQQRVDDLFGSIECPFLLNKRQHMVLLALEKELGYIEQLCDSAIPYEIVSYHLTEALAHFAELTGKSISEQGMDAVFREFCVGK